MKKSYNSQYLTRVQQCELTRAELDNEIASFKPYWKDISRYILPRRSRFFVTDVNKGDRRNTDIIDSTASLAVRTLSSGMMSGITSPARPWFKLTGSLSEEQSTVARQYLEEVESLMRSVFLRSNLYNVLPVLYGDLGAFGTAAFFMEEDADSVVNFTSFLIGSYRISCNKKGVARVFTREFQMTVRQVVEKFGGDVPGNIDWTHISQTVKEQYDKGQYESKVYIVHIIQPNRRYNPKKLESKYKKFESLYYEKGVSTITLNASNMNGDIDNFLSEKGYDFFPVLAARWEVAGEDTYGTNAPGMLALGDTKQLQLGEKRSATAIDQKVKPSMVGPLSLQNAKASILPGEITYVDERDGQRGFRRLFDIDFDIRELEDKQDRIRQRISRAFYEDLFLMLANTNRAQITAREIDERHEEKLLALGPVLERMNQDVLDPLIENTFFIMDKQGLLPEPPEELQGTDFKVEYISIMAQAQKLAGIGNIERLVGFVGQVASLNPEAAQKIDVDNIIDEYTDMVGSSLSNVKTKEQMDELRAQQQEMMQAQMEAEQQQAQVEGAKTLSETKMGEDSALDGLIEGAQ